MDLYWLSGNSTEHWYSRIPAGKQAPHTPHTSITPRLASLPTASLVCPADLHRTIGLPTPILSPPPSRLAQVDETTNPGQCWRARDSISHNHVAQYCATAEPVQYVRITPRDEVTAAAVTGMG